eukprot:9575502-Heterocapsa_arctica.AAC.1
MGSERRGQELLACKRLARLSEMKALHYDNFKNIGRLKINAKFYAQLATEPTSTTICLMSEDRRS